MKNFFEILKLIQEGDKKATIEFISQFQPLLKKYSKLLNYEDAYNDIELFFINFTYKINLEKLKNTSDNGILTYISSSVYHEYIRLSKYNKNISDHELILDDTIINIENLIFEDDDFSNVFFDGLKSHLTNKEYQVIYLMYFKNYRAAEISEIIKDSHWNIYKLKNSALSKLRTIFKK